MEFTISALVTILVVLDPIGLVPSFIAITQGLPLKSRRNVALRACLIASAILAGSALAGDWLLRMLSIGLPAFRIAGGLLLFSIASEMVFGVRVVRQTETAEHAIEGGLVCPFLRGGRGGHFLLVVASVQTLPPAAQGGE